MKKQMKHQDAPRPRLADHRELARTRGGANFVEYALVAKPTESEQ